MSFALRWYQQGAVDALFNYFANNPARYGEDGKPVQRNPLVAMPTGTGKSLTIGAFISRALKAYPSTRVIMLTHVKELIEQNAKAILNVWPQAPLGIYSAGLGKRELAQIIYAGIASIKNAVNKIGWVDIVVIDEAHLLSPNGDTMYQAFLGELRKINPWLVVVGFTATPYRMGIGMLTNNGIFTDIVYDITTIASFNRLVHEGYMSPLIPKRRAGVELDVSSVGISNGDYKQGELQTAVDQENVTHGIVRDIITMAQHYQRRCGLVFASGVDHAEHISEAFLRYGFDVPAVHSKISTEKRDGLLRDFKAGKYPAIVGNNIFTTGFDHPPVDLIAVLRPTLSTGLWVQMLGRGTRPSVETGKWNCIVLDYANNTPKLGPVNDPVIPSMKKKGVGDAPIWTCPNCGTHNHARAPVCIECGTIHDMTANLANDAGYKEVMISETPIFEMFKVDRVLYYPHEKEGKPPSMRVTYCSGLRTFDEWVCLEHGGPAAKNARDWWRQRREGDPPETTAEGLEVAEKTLAIPRRIRVHVNTKFPRVYGFEF